MGEKERREGGAKATTQEGPSLLASFRHDAPLLRSTFQSVPDVTVEVEQHFADDSEETVLTVRADGADLDAFEDALARDETVTDAECLNVERVGSRRYRLRVPSGGTLYRTWGEVGAVLVDATGQRDGWTYRMCLPTREALKAVRKAYQGQGWGFHLTRLQEASTPQADKLIGMTDKQCELLDAAYGLGYFDIPRGVKLTDLAKQFGVSDQAASERLRRGMSNHLDTTTW